AGRPRAAARGVAAHPRAPPRAARGEPARPCRAPRERRGAGGAAGCARRRPTRLPARARLEAARPDERHPFRRQPGTAARASGLAAGDRGRAEREGAVSASVAAFVITCDRPGQLAATVRALLAQSVVPDHVLVVDNRPTAESRAALVGLPRVEHTEMAEN